MCADYIRSRGVQKDPKPKIRTKNPIPEPKYLFFSVRVPEPIILSGYWFGYGSGSLSKRVPDNPIFFGNFLIFFKSMAQCPNLQSPLGSPSPTASTDQL